VWGASEQPRFGQQNATELTRDNPSPHAEGGGGGGPKKKKKKSCPRFQGTKKSVGEPEEGVEKSYLPRWGIGKGLVHDHWRVPGGGWGSRKKGRGTVDRWTLKN